MTAAPRSLLRLIILLVTLCEALVRFLILSLRLGRRITIRDRAEWLHRSCLRVLERLSFGKEFSGPLPLRGLIVSNHLSHLDILVYGAILPCVFVAKSEVRKWPIFGLLASLGGTVFIERGNTASTASAAQRMAALLQQDVPVLLFPEGTSSDGTTVLRFHPALFESAIRMATPITPAAVRYFAGIGVDERSLCYYGDVRFASHLWATLGYPEIRGRIEFATEPAIHSDRRSAALATWHSVTALRGNSPQDEDALRPAVSAAGTESGGL